MRKLHKILAPAVIGIFALTGCGGGTQAAGSSELTLAVSSEPIGLDPAVAANGNASAWFVDLAYASLLTLDENGELAPGLASSWEFTDTSNTQVRVTLQEGLTFADGTALTASSVVDSIEYFKTGSGPSSTYFKDLELEATDDLNVVITSPEPNPLLPTLLTPKYMGGGVISSAGLNSTETLNAATFGAGPYVLDTAATVSGDRYVYVPNENYYKYDELDFDKITIRIIPNLTSQVQALKTGQIDVMQGDNSIMGEVEGVDNVGITTQPTLWNGLYFADRDGTLSPELADRKVRQALNYAVDREAIAAAAYGDYGRAETQPAVPGDSSHGYDEELSKYYSYDPAKAKELLAEAGYADGFTLSVPYKGQQAPSTTMVQALSEQLKAVGVTLDLQPSTNTGEWVSKLVSQTHGAFQQDSSGRPLVLAAQMNWLPGGVLNPFNVDDPDIGAAYDELIHASTEDQEEVARDFMQMLVENAYTLPVVSADEIYLYDTEAVESVGFLGNTPKLSPIDTWTRAGE
ncbi:ABC transporter substrate-binding protein [Glutamicibacter sp. MNS18]|uniref:ABC transporter substrate-binding protein n=1 Tax=Glutamicibacter sp. MNS18 TaxID=2989817 RepID=UPI00223626E5|nr:ABC transporter substrate-binding protein [Glutamicibacter sp. MNS18]MCW4465635.1 ABC transporter substrate-binding protein [Glutamicibacter sp. MNS18]